MAYGMAMIPMWASATWLGLVVAAPWLATASPVASGLVYAAGALLCHQQPERSFHLLGAQLPVCARCLGLYAGAALGATVWWLRRRTSPRPLTPGVGALVLAAAPTAGSVLSATLGLGDPSNAWRALLAVPLGAVGGAVVGAVVSRDLK